MIKVGSKVECLRMRASIKSDSPVGVVEEIVNEPPRPIYKVKMTDGPIPDYTAWFVGFELKEV